MAEYTQLDKKHNPFQSAAKYDAKLRLAIQGPSGAGKTYSALRIAKGLAEAYGYPLESIFFIDTENGSGAKYEKVCPGFMHVDVGPKSEGMFNDFHPLNFVQLIEAAELHGARIIIIDSLSHAWAGKGGVLEIVDQEAARMKRPNNFAAWRKGTPLHNSLLEAIIGSSAHVIACMRSKTDYAQEGGKVVKVGLNPIQRDGIVYEFDVVLDMNPDHKAIVDKTRCPALTDELIPFPGEDVAETLHGWLRGKKDPYTYGNGTKVPIDPRTRRVFSEYMAANDDVPPLDGDALGVWYKKQAHAVDADEALAE